MDRLPRDYERQIAKKRLPGLLGAIATAENRAATLPEEKGRAEAVRARSLRAMVAQLLADLGEEEAPSPPTVPSRRRASAGAAQAPITGAPPAAVATPAPGPAPASPATAAPPVPGPAPASPAAAPPPAESDPAPAPAPPSPPEAAAAPALAPTPAAPLPQQAPVPQTTRTQDAGSQKLRRSAP